MILYLTYNDLPSGIYSSQVIDVVKFIKNELKTEIKLVAFISLRGFSDNKKKILNEIPDAIVAPMFPGVKRWRINSFKLKNICKKINPEMIIGRSILATNLALKTKVKNIVYDGRGAIAAEWKEYGVINDPKMLEESSELEKTAILQSSFRISVSDQLITHWRNEYNYNNDKHVVIPCTLNRPFETVIISQENISQSRKKLGLNTEDTVFIYSGSLAGWQSFDILYKFIHPILKNSSNNKLVFLSSPDKHITDLEKEFPGKIICKKVSPSEVPELLIAGDYGLLIREESITNLVASPVKYAEYLACGLKVIISNQLGDYTHFTKKNNLGVLYSDFSAPEKISLQQKQTIKLMALTHFTKKSYLKMYEKVINSTHS